MYTVLFDKHYVKQLKKLSKQKQFAISALEEVVNILKRGERVPARYKDHKLHGKLDAYRELHVKSDMLLVYTKNDSELILILVALGTHSSLFK